MDYKTNKNDLLHLWATIWGIYEEKYNDGSTPSSFSYDYWLYEIAKLIDHNDLKKADDATSQAVLDFATVYAVASSISEGQAILDNPDLNKIEYMEDHCKFDLREIVFLKPWTKALEILESNFPNASPELKEYIKRGFETKAPNNEEDFIEWAVYSMQDPEDFRKDYRLTQDLRDAYRRLIKAAEPYIKANNKAQEAEKLYKDFYNFTALEWLVVLPM